PQDADVACSIFGVLVISANPVGSFGSATAPIREPFLNLFKKHKKCSFKYGFSWNAISGLAAPKVIRTTIEVSPSSLIITSHFPPLQCGLVLRIVSTCLRIAESEASKDKTNEKDVSDSADVRVQLVKGRSRK